MTEWAREERYQRIEDVDTEYLKILKQQISQSKSHQQFHIQSKTGSSDDPNGLIFYKGKYYVSHQQFPLDAVRGLKCWYNYTSDDLVNSKTEGSILNPDIGYDNHGIYSGNASEYDRHLYYIHTGNHRDNHWQRHANQMIVQLKKDDSVKESSKPVISWQPGGYTSHFRDPKAFEYDERYYAIIDTQNNDQQGRLLLYNTEDITSWYYLGETNTELDDFGYMWECSNYFSVDNQDVILVCPQGIEPKGDQFRSIYQSGYILRKSDIEKLTYEYENFVELDNGFDFYAPQAFLDEKGRRVLIGWMGLPEIEYPADNGGQAHCLATPRILSVKDGQSRQHPYPALEKLRHSEEAVLDYTNKFTRKLHPYEGKQHELIVDILDSDAAEVHFELRTSKTSSTLIAYNGREDKITLDRSDSGLSPTNVKGTTRSTVSDTLSKQLQIFVDTSSIEIFCNNGEHVLTPRTFPTEDALGTRASTESGQVYLQFTKYDLKGGHK